MKKRILAFNVNYVGENKCLIPTGAKVLSVILKNDIVTLYVLADTENGLEERTFVNHITEDIVDFSDGNEHKFIGSYSQGGMVYHLFELI